MISIRVANEAAFKKQVADWFVKAKEEVAKATKGVAIEAFRHITTHGPQFTGDFVSNINLSIDIPSPAFQENRLKAYNPNASLRYGFPKQEGDRLAISTANAYAVGNLAKYQFGQSIFITSAATHDEQYAFKIEKNQIAFRPENKSRGATFSKAHNFVAGKYSGEIGRVEFVKLQRMRLSGASS